MLEQAQNSEKTEKNKIFFKRGKKTVLVTDDFTLKPEQFYRATMGWVVTDAADPVKQDHFFDKLDWGGTTRNEKFSTTCDTLIGQCVANSITHTHRADCAGISSAIDDHAAPPSLGYSDGISLPQRLKEKHIPRCSGTISAQWSNISKNCLLEKYQRWPADQNRTAHTKPHTQTLDPLCLGSVCVCACAVWVT